MLWQIMTGGRWKIIYIYLQTTSNPFAQSLVEEIAARGKDSQWVVSDDIPAEKK